VSRTVGGTATVGVAVFYGSRQFAGKEVLATDADVIISDLAGFTLSPAGDVNADGRGDFIVGGSTVRVFFGGDLPW
jgi:hypothetical protein